ncbi:hypothetical protein [Flavihumibacter sp. UBA7668]
MFILFNGTGKPAVEKGEIKPYISLFGGFPFQIRIGSDSSKYGISTS